MGIVDKFNKRTAQAYQPGLKPGDEIEVLKPEFAGATGTITVIDADGSMSVDIPGDPVKSVTLYEGEWQPIGGEQPPAETEQAEGPKQHDPEALANAMQSSDDLVKLNFKRLATQIEFSAACAQELGEDDQKRFYAYFQNKVKELQAEFEKEHNPEGGYAPPPKKNTYARPPRNAKPWHRY